MSNCASLSAARLLRGGYRVGDRAEVRSNSMIHDGLWDVYEDFQHGRMTAELVAEKYNIPAKSRTNSLFKAITRMSHSGHELPALSNLKSCR